ncbi:SDR family oxidoreductase [Hymenobacter wooponensis]|uniref:SDR family oxidoreductase n=1 Tax=Hymenobacter wooponensis TaxID=1525360 RepID=A0A4Z0MHR6_9BACT|nr:SDR family oxidoreductase [Hymenobacter wooponensis]TGD79352.1 SDR family oxidoreductase [Hymenobacter wooponensis]
MSTNTILVVGGNGIIGRNAVSYLHSTGQWNVIVTSASALDYETPARYVQLDLLNPQAVADQAEQLREVTHVIYAAYIEGKTLAAQTEVNLALLRNLVLGLEQLAPNFQHITFIQGGKAYGAHLGRYKTPALETDPRHFPPNFYYSQEDFLREQSSGKAWSWTAVRPDIVVGFAVGNPMNLANLIAVYASLCKELHVPFRFPGSLQAYHVLVNVTDATLLAEGMEWVATHDECREQIYNVTNGDIFRWSQLWPKFAEYFGVEYAEPITFPLHEYMQDKAELWQQMVQKHGLKEHTLDELVQWPFGDFIFNVEADAFFDVNKLRRAGFHNMHLDSFISFRNQFEHLKAEKIIP